MAVATVRLGYSLAGLVLGMAVLAVAAALSGALPSPVATPAATPIAGPILGGAAIPASVRTSAPTLSVPATVAVSGPVAIASAPTSAAPSPAPAAASVEEQLAGAAKIAIATYRNGGHRYSGLSAEAGTTVVAARAATVQVRTYQLVDGDVRVGSNVPWLPFFAYVTLTTADGKLTYRPGALRSDTELLVEDGDVVTEGAPLFRVIGSGASSWATFYDASVAYNVVVSLVAVPSGADLDAAPLIATR